MYLEKYEHDLRILKINWLTHYNAKISNWIKKIFREAEICSNFPSLFIEIKHNVAKKYGGVAKGGVSAKDILSGNDKISISSFVWEKNEISSDLLLEIKETIIHELTHIYHNHISGRLKKDYQTSLSIQHKLPRKYKNTAIQSNLTALLDFFRKLSTEGLARISQKMDRYEIKFTSKKFVAGHTQMQKLVKRLHDNFIQAINDRDSHKFQSMSQKQAYEIGFFMIFTIALSRHNLNMEDIAKMKVFEFIKEYEKASVKLGKIPLITRNSKGILDLTQILKKIKQLEKDLKKNDLPWWRHYLGFGRI